MIIWLRHDDYTIYPDNVNENTGSNFLLGFMAPLKRLGESLAHVL